MGHRATILIAVALVVVASAVGCGGDLPPAGPAAPAAAPATSSRPEPAAAPSGCVDAGEATRTGVEGEPVWVRFCPGRKGLTAPAEVPSDALTTHLGSLGSLAGSALPEPRGDACSGFSSRTYRLQIGYADGRVAQVSGATDPECRGTIRAGGLSVAGPVRLGVYGVVMSAFGRQHADAFDATAPDSPLTCPVGPRNPDSVDVDGPSADLETGYHLGRRVPMMMPLTAERGIVCTWRGRGDEPTVRPLSAEDAERVRIGMHAISGGMVDCALTPGPTYAAVVEDTTGTRRAVTIIESECSTVVRSDRGYGLGFPWLDY